MSKIIFHVDMDCFFAACEIKENPKLGELPVVIGADPKGGKGRGVVSTCNYVARKFGIKSAMPISRAYKLNPKAIFLPVNFRLYGEISSKIMRILKNHSSRFQQMGIDEAYIDVTEAAANFEQAKNLAMEIKQEIKEKEGLSCSIGISTNKLVAKIASDFQKPNGLTLVKEHDIKQFLSPLNVRKLYGIGPKTEQRLKEMGIKTISQLANYNKEKLIKEFGVYGLYLSLSSNGNGDDFVAQEHTRVSIGRERTFEKDIGNFDSICNIIEELSLEVYNELLDEKIVFKTVSIKIRMHDFSTYTRARTVNCHINDSNEISRAAKDLAREFIGNKIRLIGVRVSGLKENKSQKTILEFFQ